MATAQSRLYYFRPLLDGETISYEFQYEPEKYEAHPALGRLAFLIEPGGVRLHWMTDGEREWTGLAEDNAVVEPLNRRGPKPLPLVSEDWNRMTAALADDQVPLTLNERVIYQRRLKPDEERTFGFYHWRRSSAVRDLRITGQPVIPGEVNLTESQGRLGWLPYFEESFAGFNRDWQFAGSELVSQRRSRLSALARESLLQYHRPMFEDRTIEYEFYYNPQRSHVHPVLDRLALLLEPAGVRVHWITDGVHDRTGLDPVNAFAEPKNRRGPNRLPLVEGDWNKLRLTLTGDTVSIALNDQLVYERELEATNLRTFGLFHNANQTEARVRNIVWRGDWPRELPRLSQQELADVSTTEMPKGKLPKLTEVIEIDFARQGLPRELLHPRSPLTRRLSASRWHSRHIDRSRRGQSILLP